MTAIISAAAIAVMTVGVFGQAKPNFAGKWAREAPAEGAAGGGGGGRGGFGRGGFGQEVTITQDAATIKMEYMQGQAGMVTRTYKLDGSESKNTMSFGGNEIEQVSKAVWEGDKLAITTTGGRGGETKQVLSLEGGNLVVEQTAPGRGGGAPTTTKIVYKKAQ